MRIVAISDLHVDYRDNADWIEHLAQRDHGDDVLLLAGDLTDDLELLERTLAVLRRRFGAVVFVPGNHELWVRRGNFACSRDKFEAILDLCERLDVRTEPTRVGLGGEAVWIVPLFSWYALPHDEAESSLYQFRPGPDLGLAAWSDTHFVRWPASVGHEVARHFAERNHDRVRADYDAPVITLSHFLPRGELMYPPPGHRRLVQTRIPFNFSRVAGSTLIEQQLRALGSRVHVYGHQHRNADRRLEGVRYVSNCLGYVSERRRGLVDAREITLQSVWGSS